MLGIPAIDMLSVYFYKKAISYEGLIKPQLISKDRLSTKCLKRLKHKLSVLIASFCTSSFDHSPIQLLPEEKKTNISPR
jgi:hypothetical protein